jgi:hypothetical protein
MGPLKREGHWIVQARRAECGCNSHSCAILRTRLRFRIFTSLRSPHSRVATPLDLCHLSRLNIYLKRAARAGEPIFRQRHDIVTGAERESKATFIICCKRCDRALLGRDGKDRVWNRCYVWNLGSFSNRPGSDRTERNDSLDSGTPTSFGFSIGKGSTHKEEREKQCEVST